MRIISFIEDGGVVEKILRHLGLWETRNHDPPAPDGPETPSSPIMTIIHRFLPSIIISNSRFRFLSHTG